jgi:predicted dehydrogenase
MKNIITPADFSRRHFLKTSSLLAAGTVIAPSIITVRAAADDPQIRIGLVGCGSRGLGAVGNAMGAAPNVKLVALADVFPDRLKAAKEQLAKMASSPQANTWAAGTETKDLKGIDFSVPDDHCFTGFDAYKKLFAIPEINYVILATPPGFRSIHLAAAIEAGKHAFVEKPVAVDPAGIRAVIAAGEAAKKKNLGIVAGTQRRHQNNYVETMKRILDGAIGEITSARCYWCQGGVWMKDRLPEWSDMEWQLRNWMYFTWLAGDIIVEQHLHNIDVISWAIQKHPLTAMGVGGRTVRNTPEYGHIYDHFAVEFEYPGGVRMQSYSRQWDNCSSTIGEAVVGTKGTSDCKGYIKVGKENWRFPDKIKNPYDQEHTDFINSIRAGQPLNEAQQVAESNLAAIMGREAAYTGQVIDWDTAMESTLSLAPKAYEFGPLPVSPVPVPGKYKFE